MIDFKLDFLLSSFVGKVVPRPISGTLSGHAAGEPFAKLVYEEIHSKWPNNTYMNFSYLNELYLHNPHATTCSDRFDLVNSVPLAYLLCRPKGPTQRWSPTNQFEEKQNDTADIILKDGPFCDIIDVKSYNVKLKGQPPNIISATKVAHMCKLMIDHNDYNSFDITYIGVEWIYDSKFLICSGITSKELFKTNPSNLYINWAAATQIQFHVHDLKQDYYLPKEIWVKDYLKHFVKMASERSKTIINNYVLPYQKYV